MSFVFTAKASAILILVISVSLVQVTVFLMQPKNSSLININGASGIVPPVYSAQTSTAALTMQTVTVTTPTNLTVIRLSTVATTVVMTNSTTLLVQSVAGPDYTPVGIAIVAAVAIIVLVLMFLRRRR